MSLPTLTSEQLQRYARHLTLPEVGVDGQRRLAAARVLLIGAGGLGSPAALYLAAAGVGTLGVVDDDVVDISNLQRQILHGTGTIGVPKSESTAARLGDLNPDVQVIQHRERLQSHNARAIIASYDLVLDGSDNFPTRYLVNDACVLERKPFVYGSIYRFEGQLSLFGAPDGPCYRCLFAEPPAPELVPSCVDAGVLGVLPGIVGTLQALEAIKWITGIGESAVGRLLLIDALALRFREIAIRRDPECVMCSDTATITELIDYEAFCGVAPFGSAGSTHEVTASELALELAADRPPVLIDVREPWEFDLAHLEGARLVPLGELPARLTELPAKSSLVTVCHKGVRSERAAALLRRAGFADVRSLAGGVDAWAEGVDPAMRRY
jgi:molybdopterin/thiamine biosynthesis adenylyltransferase/rhodanese-related sulfurtransferase